MSTLVLSLLVKVTIVLGLGLGLTALTRKAPAAFRHVILLGTMMSALMLPLLGLVAPRWGVPVLDPAGARASSSEIAPNLTPTGALLENPSVVSTPALNTSPENSSRSVPPTTTPWAGPRSLSPITLITGWLVGSLAVLGWLALGHLRLRRLSDKSWPLDGADWIETLSQEQRSLGVTGHIELLCHPDVSTPLTWGSFKPVIMLPEEALEWDDEHRRIVLRHELSHVSRNDAMAQLGAGLTCAVYWFHPLVWIAERRLRAECERACDDRVVATGTPAPVYAAHLLEVARSARSFGGPGFLSVAMARPSQLEGRLLAVLDESRPRNTVSTRTRWLTLASISAIAFAVSAFRPVDRQVVRIESLDAKLRAAGFRPLQRATGTVEAPPYRANTIAREATPTAETGATSTVASEATPIIRDSVFERTVDAASGGTLILDFTRSGATITITGWDRPQVSVQGMLGGRSWRDTETTFERVTGGVLLRNDYVGNARNTSFSHAFAIRVPRNFNVRLKSAGGGISISGVTGRFTGTTGGGAIELDRLSGEVGLTTGGGEVNVSNSPSLAGSVTTGGGAVIIDRSGRGVVGHSGSGDVAYTNSRPTTAGGNGLNSTANGGIPLSGGTTTFLINDHPDSVRHFGEDGIQRHRSGGDITLGEAPAGARVSTGGGAIRIGPSGGQVYASTGGGSIEIGPASGSVIASTGAGDVTLTFRGPGVHAADVTSGLGEIELILPENINAELVLETAYTNNLAHKTRIESDWALPIRETNQWDGSIGTPRKYVRARKILGTGGGVIRVRTVNGNVVVRKSSRL